MALVAFETAVKASRPPVGERFVDSDGIGWASRQDFAQNVASVFELQVKAEAHRLGIGGDEYAAETRRLALWRAGQDEHPTVSTRRTEAAQ